MEELSNFLDPGDDDLMNAEDDDYIPESLASFVAEANKTLAAAKLNFQDDVEDTPSDFVDQSMDTSPRHVLVEDDDDRKLKKQVLDSFNKGMMSPSFMSPEDPSSQVNPAAHLLSAEAKQLAMEGATPRTGTNLFREAFREIALEEDIPAVILLQDTVDVPTNVFQKISLAMTTPISETPEATPPVKPAPIREATPPAKPTPEPTPPPKLTPTREATPRTSNMTPAAKLANTSQVAADQPNPLDDAGFFPEPVDAPKLPNAAAFVPPVGNQAAEDAVFLPNIRPVHVEKKIPPKPVRTRAPPPKTTTVSRRPMSTSRTKAPIANATKTSTAPPPRRKMSSTAASVSRLLQSTATSAAHSSPVRAENRGNAAKPSDAMAKARERVRARQLMERKKLQEPATTKREQLPTATRAMRTRTVPLTSVQKTVGRTPKVDVEAQVKAEEERRTRTAERVRSYGSGSTISKVQKVSTSRAWRPPTVPTPTNRPTKERPRLTTPKPFHFHGKEPSHSTPRGDKSVISMAESMNDFMRKGLRHSTPTPKCVGRPRVTTPRPFRFADTKSEQVTPAVSIEEKKMTSTLGEKLHDYDLHLRDAGPPLPVTTRDRDRPTIPKSPKFTPVANRERPKSTKERDMEMMEYYENHPFRAVPIMTQDPSAGRGLAGIPKVSKKALTVPKPFRLSMASRGLHAKHQELSPKEESKTHKFHARPMPPFKASPPPASKLKLPTRLVTRSVRVPRAETLISPRDQDDIDECKQQFHARPIPNFKSGSKSPPNQPNRFLSVRSNVLKAEKVHKNAVPKTIEVRSRFPFGSARIAPSSDGSSPSMSPRKVTQPRAFRLSSGNRVAAVADPNEEELKKQFKARPLPASTFVPSSSIASPSRVPSTISTISAPRLATEDRREPREGATLASRINTELMSRERASDKQRKQTERHEEDMRKAALPSPNKLKAESMTPFHFESDARHEAHQKAHQKKLHEQLEEEERERIRHFEGVKATPMPNFSPMKSPEGGRMSTSAMIETKQE